MSQDYGTSWRQDPIPGSQACGELVGLQRVAVDRAGTVYAVWIEDTDAQVYLSVSRDHARTWSTPVNVMAPGTTFSLSEANIAVGSPGHIMIAGLQTTASTRPVSPPLFPGIYSGPAHAVLTESWDATAARPHFTTVDLDADGDLTLGDGAGNNEMNASLAMTASDVGWAVFSRHSDGSMDPGDIEAARLFPR